MDILHQFTYFIGPVNFILKMVKKKVAIMNTGDSMYMTYILLFTTQINKKMF